MVEEPDCNDDVACAVFAAVRGYGELSDLALHVEHSLVEPDVELLLRRDAAVILDRFFAGRLLALDGKWIAADFNQIWRREKLHPRGIADDGVDQASLFNDQRLKTFALDLDAAGQTNRSGPHHDCAVH